MTTAPGRLPRIALLVGVALTLTSLPPTIAATGNDPFDRGLAGIRLRVRDVVIPYREFAVFALPGERVALELVARGSTRYRLDDDGVEVKPTSAGHWSWRAPAAPGLRRLTLSTEGGDTAMRLNAFVMVPASEVRDGRLDGYGIGDYPAKPLKGMAIYRPPRGFIRLTDEVAGVHVSPHFTLGQFRCKQDGGPPAYLVLREQLPLKLESLLDLVNRHGIRTDSFHVMSGFRTPAYNRAIGNRPYSRHMWGGAADIFVDVAPADGVMDDLDGNGRIDEKDAAVLYDLIDAESSRPTFREHVGGLGNYGSTASHGPFVHVDARGFRARWGR